MRGDFTGPGPGPCATAAGCRAVAEGSPVTNDTVNGAFADVTVLRLLSLLASDTAKLRFAVDVPDTVLGATAARDGACVEHTPITKDAINSAHVSCARYRLLGGCAGNTTVQCLLEHTAVAGVGATTTSDGAAEEVTPVAHFAIHGASIGIAFDGFLRRLALNTAMHSVDGDSARAGLSASATGARASYVIPVLGVPGTHDAVDGAVGKIEA